MISQPYKEILKLQSLCVNIYIDLWPKKSPVQDHEDTTVRMVAKRLRLSKWENDVENS